MKIPLNFLSIAACVCIFSGTAWATPDVDGPDVDFPAPSPNGNNLAFSSTAGLSGTFDIWLSDRDGKNAQILVPWSDSDEMHPDWSPDSRQLVFCSSRQGVQDIWIINLAEQSLTQLTSDKSNNCQPRFSRDGKNIAFVSNRTGKRELWIMKADGSDQKPVALIPMRISDPTWSPSGDRLAYVGCKATRCNIYSIGVDGGDGRQITFDEHYDRQPDWGMAGIVFTSTRDRVRGLWVVQPNGTEPTLVPDVGIRGDFSPRWDEANNTIVFSRVAGDIIGTRPQIFELVVGAPSSQQVTTVSQVVATPQVPVDERVTVSYGSVRFDRRTQEFTIPATLTNISNEDLAGPVWLVISSLSPSEATIANASGNTADGRPYVQVIGEGVVWQADQSLPTISLRIRNPIREPLNFEEQVLAIIP